MARTVRDWFNSLSEVDRTAGVIQDWFDSLPEELKDSSEIESLPAGTSSSKKIGYARVSTKDQNLNSQVYSLTNAGCSLIFEESASGKNLDRPELQKALECLNAGDTLVVYKLDRLSRSLIDLHNLTKLLEQRGINFQSTTQDINTSNPMGKFFYSLMGAIAELNREQIVERTLAGLEAARRSGKKLGPKRKADPREVDALLDAGLSPQEVCKRLSISRATLYRVARKNAA